MQSIYKYPLSQNDNPNVVTMPQGALILSAQVQRGQVCLWALVDPSRPTEQRTFQVYGTGWEIDGKGTDHLRFISTVQTNGGVFVFHVFESMAVTVDA